jgi:hypothetical protein
MPGGKPGHEGLRRKPPVAIDAQVERRLGACPCCCCGGGLPRCDRTRTRLIEDVPVDVKPEVGDERRWNPRAVPPGRSVAVCGYAPVKIV